MSGDETERFCTKCRQTVYNLTNLTLDQRLTILNAPSGSVCGRYRIAVRRAYPGKEAAYMRRLAKYGAVVAASSAALITLWQIYAVDGRPIVNRFRVAPVEIREPAADDDTFYHEYTGMILGMIAPVENPLGATCDVPMMGPEKMIEVQLEPVEVSKLMAALRPTEQPPLLGQLELPVVKRKKAR